jgi:hypothetical protein
MPIAQSRADMGGMAKGNAHRYQCRGDDVKHTHDAEIDRLLQIRLDTGQHGEAAGNVEPADHDLGLTSISTSFRSPAQDWADHPASGTRP